MSNPEVRIIVTDANGKIFSRAAEIILTTENPDWRAGLVSTVIWLTRKLATMIEHEGKMS